MEFLIWDKFYSSPDYKKAYIRALRIYEAITGDK